MPNTDKELTVEECLAELREMFGDEPCIAITEQHTRSIGLALTQAQTSTLIQVGTYITPPESTLAAAMDRVRSWKEAQQ